MTIHLRTDLRPGDLGAIIRWQGLTYWAEQRFDPHFEAYVAEAMGAFAAKGGPRERLWIAEDDGALVGCIALVASQQDPRGTAQLRWFLVDPCARGRGLGRRLLTAAHDFARAEGYERVSLWTVSSLEAAARLYRAAGYQLREGRPAHHWGVDVVEQRYELALEA